MAGELDGSSEVQSIQNSANNFIFVVVKMLDQLAKRVFSSSTLPTTLSDREGK